MPMKTTVGLCQKLGQPDYGSLGASCHVEFELDQALPQQDLEAFHQQVRDAFDACRRAVAEELTRPTRSPATSTHGTPAPATDGNRHSHPPVNRDAHQIPPSASDKQLAYLRRLAHQIPELGLPRLNEVAQCVCGETVSALSTTEASRLIDTLKAVKAGTRNLHDLFTGAPA